MLLSKNTSNATTREPALPAPIARFPSVNGATGTDDRIAFTIGYMQEFLSQPLQVPALARLANLSPSHFFAVFKKRTGFAPKDFFIRLKIQRACEILEATDLCVKEVAAKLGYDDAFYFSRLFKSVNGVAPTEYRRLAETQRRAIRCETLPQRMAGEFQASPPKRPANWFEFASPLNGTPRIHHD
jgi:transcriptional regulator GlxA family with amidase domain